MTVYDIGEQVETCELIYANKKVPEYTRYKTIYSNSFLFQIWIEICMSKDIVGKSVVDTNHLGPWSRMLAGGIFMLSLFFPEDFGG